MHSICEQGSKQRQHDRSHKDPDYTEHAPEEGLRGFITVSSKVIVLNSAVREVKLYLFEDEHGSNGSHIRVLILNYLSHLNTLHDCNRYLCYCLTPDRMHSRHNVNTKRNVFFFFFAVQNNLLCQEGRGPFWPWKTANTALFDRRHLKK